MSKKGDNGKASKEEAERSYDAEDSIEQTWRSVKQANKKNGDEKRKR